MDDPMDPIKNSAMNAHLKSIEKQLLKMCNLDKNSNEEQNKSNLIVNPHDPEAYELEEKLLENRVKNIDKMEGNPLEPKTKNSEFSINIRTKGNELYKKVSNKNIKEYSNIINEYSKSLVFAPIDSEEYALALSNRSVMLLRISKFQESIIDINAALKITKNHATKFKLYCRKTECLACLGKNTEMKESFTAALETIQLLDKSLKNTSIKNLYDAAKKKTVENIAVNKRHERLQAENIISNAIAWKYNEKYGNHIIANRDIKVGEILIIEDFYCGYPEKTSSFFYLTCSNCLKFTLNSIPCEHCVYVVFCSKKCKAQAWTKFHETECKAYEYYFSYAGFGLKLTAALVVFRTFLMFLNEFDIDNLYKESQKIDKLLDKSKTVFSNAIIKNTDKKFQFVYGLEKTDTEENYSLKTLYYTLSKNIFFCLQQVKNYPHTSFWNNFDKLRTIVCKLIDIYRFHSVRKQQFCHDYDELTGLAELGWVLPGTSGLINHSCIPNASATFSSNSKIIIFADKPIKKNEQIFLSYNLCFNQSEEYYKKNRKHICDCHNFQCDCIACTKNWKPMKLPKDNEVLKLKHKEIYKYFEWVNEVGYEDEDYLNDYSIKNVNKICEMIEKGYSTLSTYDATIALSGIKNSLKIQYTNLYCSEENCT